MNPFPFRLFAATGDAVAQLDSHNGETLVASLNLEGRGVMCVAVDPHDPQRIFAGTFDRGIYRSLDGGDIWESVGSGVPGTAISNYGGRNDSKYVPASAHPLLWSSSRTTSFGAPGSVSTVTPRDLCFVLTNKLTCNCCVVRA